MTSRISSSTLYLLLSNPLVCNRFVAGINFKWLSHNLLILKPTDFPIETKLTWDDGTFTEVVRDTLPFLPTNDKGLLQEFLQMWARDISKLPKLSDNTDEFAASAKANEMCETRFDIWQQVLISNPEFTVALLRGIVTHNASTGAANREISRQLNILILESWGLQLLSKKVAKSFTQKLSQINFEG